MTKFPVYKKPLCLLQHKCATQQKLNPGDAAWPNKKARSFERAFFIHKIH